MSNDTHATLDPSEVWQQWYDAATTAWTKAVRGETASYTDPLGFYRQWLNGFTAAPERSGEPSQDGGTLAPPNPAEIWKQWLEATAKVWETAAPMGGAAMGWTSQWMEMLEEARAKLLAGQQVPMDPLSFAIDWYNATSELWSKAVGDVIGNEGFVAMASRFLEGYMTYARTFRHLAQEYVSALQIASRQDVARAAGLVVALEDKVDHLEDRLDELTATSSKIVRSNLIPNELLGSLERRLSEALGERGALEHRLGVVEEKLSRLEQNTGQLQHTLERVLTAVEKGLEARNAGARAEPAEERKAGTRRAPTSDQAPDQA